MDKESPLRRMRGLFLNLPEKTGLFWLAVSSNTKICAEDRGRLRNNLCYFLGTQSLKFNIVSCFQIRSERDLDLVGDIWFSSF